MPTDFNTRSISPPENENRINLREIFFKYASHLPLFLLSMALSLGFSALYLRYVIPIYRASANMLIRTTEDNSVSGNGDIVSNAVFGGKRINLDNEIERLRSNSFLSRVVIRTKFNIDYFDVGNIKKSNIYTDCSFTFYPIKVYDSSSVREIYFKKMNSKGGYLSKSGDKNLTTEDVAFRWDDTVHYAGIDFIPIRKNSIPNDYSKITEVMWSPVAMAARELKGSLLIGALNAKATIIQLSVKHQNPKKAKDLLNELIAEYALMNIEDKNKIAQRTIQFVDDRLAVVTDELDKVTRELQKYNEDNGILDINKQFQFYLDNSFSNVNEVYRIEGENSNIEELKKTILKKEAKDSLVPVSLGIMDITLNTLISKYNEMQLKKNRELEMKNLLEKNSIVKQYEIELNDLRRGMIEALNSIKVNNIKKIETFKNRNVDNKTVLSKIPKYITDQAELTRQQNIKQQLFLFLLQKKEETQISSASTVSDYTQLEVAEASGAPVEPNTKNTKLFSIILGLLIPVGIIYLIDLLNDKVITRDDVIRKTKATICGEISHVDRVISNIVVSQSRSIIAEQFRILRSNLQFVLNSDNAKVIMVTSSISGEGKSFISLNLASVISLSGKRVALLEFDLRKMRTNVYTGEHQNPKGITNYLIGQTDNVEDIITVVDNFPDLHIYRSGPIPPNPAELLLSERTTTLIETLKQRYDYLIIDSAPVGLVSDSFSLVKYTNNILYVIRQRYTFKKQMDFLNDLIIQNKLVNVSLVVNDVHLGGKYGYYGYSYGYGYGYIYRYGMGYRYGYGYGAYGGKYFSKGAEGYFDLPSKKKKN